MPKKEKKSAVPKGHTINFETLSRAFDNGDTCLMRCRDKRTGEYVTVLCVCQSEAGEYTFLPFAKFFEGNPFEEVEPPTKN